MKVDKDLMRLMRMNKKDYLRKIKESVGFEEYRYWIYAYRDYRRFISEEKFKWAKFFNVSLDKIKIMDLNYVPRFFKIKYNNIEK